MKIKMENSYWSQGPYFYNSTINWPQFLLCKDYLDIYLYSCKHAHLKDTSAILLIAYLWHNIAILVATLDNPKQVIENYWIKTLWTLKWFSILKHYYK